MSMVHKHWIKTHVQMIICSTSKGRSQLLFFGSLKEPGNKFGIFVIYSITWVYRK